MDFNQKPYLQKYEIGKKISEDQVSRIYVAFDKISGEKFIIRFFDFEEEPELESVFQTDILSMSMITHPNLPKFFKYSDENYKYCTIRSFLEGNSVYAILANKKYDIPISFIFKIFSEIFETVSFLHENGIFHGFLNPSNIIIDKGKVQVINYKNYLLLKNQFPSLYNLPYFSPEQINGDEIDQRSDIYTLGIILYELFTGKKPYSTDISLGFKEIENNILKEEPTIPSLYNLDISSKLENIILKCMAKNKENRFNSIKELETEFNAWFSSEHSSDAIDDNQIFNIFENQTKAEKAVDIINNEIVVKQKLKIEDDIKSDKNSEIKTFSWIKDVTNDFLITNTESFDEIRTRFDEGISGLAITDNRYYMPLYKSLPLMCLDYDKSDFSYKETLKNIIDSSTETELRSCSKRNEEVAVLIHNILSPPDNKYIFDNIKSFKEFFESKESFTGFIRFTSNLKKLRILNLEKDILMHSLADSFMKNKYEYKNISDEYALKEFIEYENFNVVLYDIDFQNYIEEYIEKMPNVVFVGTGKRMEILESKDKYENKYKNLFFIEKECSVAYFENIKVYLEKIELAVQSKEYIYYFCYLNGSRKFALQICPDTGKTNEIKLGSLLLIHAKEIISYEVSIRISDFCASSIWENTEINLRYKRNNEAILENILNGSLPLTDQNINDVRKNLIRENEHNLNFYFSANKNILNSTYYKFPEWVIDTLFYELIKITKDKELKVLLNNIATIRKITFFEQLEKYIFDIVFRTGIGSLCVAYFGAGNDFELIDFVEKIKEENSISSKKITSAFYIAVDGYTQGSINFYNDCTKQSSSFFDRSGKLKGIVKTDSEENNFQLILLNKKDNIYTIAEPR
ncbi:MAG: protein kinase [Candidatus Sericytochromatia bacterium]